AKLAELQPSPRMFEVVSEHSGHVGLEDVGPATDVENYVDRREAPIQIVDVERVEDEIVEEGGETEPGDGRELVGSTGKGVDHENPVAPQCIERANDAGADKSGSPGHHAPSRRHDVLARSAVTCPRRSLGSFRPRTRPWGPTSQDRSAATGSAT